MMIKGKQIVGKYILGSLGIAPTFLKLDWWSQGAGLFLLYPPKGLNQIKIKLSFMHTKRFNTFFKRWVQFHVYHILICNKRENSKGVFHFAEPGQTLGLSNHSISEKGFIAFYK